jgi:uncharacterized DUF497 family protein
LGQIRTCACGWASDRTLADRHAQAAPNRRQAFVVFTLRNHGKSVLVRPISARYMHKREVKNYEKNYPDV